MRKIFTATLFVLCSFNLYCQIFEQSITVNRYTIIGTGITEDAKKAKTIQLENTSYLFQYGLGFSFPVYSPSENVTLGINANAYLGKMLMSAGSSGEVAYDFCLPITATFRFGAGSNRQAIAPVGLGLGIGCILNTLVADSDVFYEPGGDKFIYNYVVPYAFAEIVFDYRKRKSFFDNFKIQIAVQPMISTNSYSELAEEEYGYDMSYMSISIIKFNPFH